MDYSRRKLEDPSFWDPNDVVGNEVQVVSARKDGVEVCDEVFRLLPKRLSLYGQEHIPVGPGSCPSRVTLNVTRLWVVIW